MKYSEDDIFRAFREGYLACFEYHAPDLGHESSMETTVQEHDAEQAAHNYLDKLKAHAVEKDPNPALKSDAQIHSS